MITVAIVEDNNTLRNSLSSLINNSEGMKCVAALGNLLNVVAEIKKAKPDIIFNGYRVAWYIWN